MARGTTASSVIPTHVAGAPTTRAWLKVLRGFGRLDFLRYGVRDRALRAVFHPDKPRDLAFEVAFLGARYPGNFANYIDWCVFFFGAYESPILAFLKDAASRVHQPVFVDVGANVGVHSLFMALHAAQVHAFEPYYRVRQQMADKIAANALTNVTVHPLALGEHDEERAFYAPAKTNAGVGTFIASSDMDKVVLPTPLRICNGDRYFAACGLDRIDLIKIDAEGMDLFVIAGLRDVIARNRPIIVMEVDARTRAVGRSEDLADKVGPNYRAFAIRGPRYRCVFFSEPSDRYHLSPFHWEEADVTEVVLAPVEKSGWLSGSDTERAP